MKNWHQVGIAVAIVVSISLILNFAGITDGTGKFLAYATVGFLLTLAIQLKNINQTGEKAESGEFVLGLIVNTAMVLFFATIVLIVIGRI